jgi:hypothetical protein
MPFNPQKTLTSSKLRPLDPDRVEMVSVLLGPAVTLLAGQILEEVFNATATEVQTVTVNGTPTGGTFVIGLPSLSGGYDVTVPIAYNATAAVVQAAFDSLVGAGNSVVTGAAGGPWTVTYAQDLANRPIALPTLVTNGLTGGSTPTVAFAHGTTGSVGALECCQAYASGNARFVLAQNVRTDFAGRVIDEFGAGTVMTVPAFRKCTILGSDLIGNDSTAIPDTGAMGKLGRLVSGQTVATAGSVVSIG